MLRALLSRFLTVLAIASILFVASTWLDLRNVSNRLRSTSSAAVKAADQLSAQASSSPHAPAPDSLEDVVSTTATTEPGKGSRKVRVAIGDSHLAGHDEVLGPILFTLSTIPGVEVTVFRDQFRAGFAEIIAAWYNRPFHAFQQLFDPVHANLNETDFLILNTADRDVGKLVEHKMFQSYPSLKVIAVAHRSLRYAFHAKASSARNHDWTIVKDALRSLARFHHDDRLSFITLAPNMQASLGRILSSGILENASPPRIGTFVPIMPFKRKPPTMARRRMLECAVIQGTLHSWSRAYDTIFSSLERKLGKFPQRWGYKQTASGIYQEHAGSRTQPFKLMLVGHKDKRETLIIPPTVRNVVELYKDVPYPEFYDQIGKADLLIPAFRQKDLYLHTAASSSIPAAIMARTTILASQAELEAYSYLKGPAVVLRQDGEDEVSAVARLRRDKTNVWSTAREWDAYENSLLDANRAMMLELLGLP